MPPDLSLCIVGNSPALLPLLRAVHETADPVSFEAIVVELAPGGVAEAILAEFPTTKVFAQAPSLSYTRDRNLALRLAEGRYLMLLDQEVVVRPGCLRRLVDFMDDNPEAGIVGPKVIDGYGRIEPSARTLPDPLLLFAYYTPLFGARLEMSTLVGRHRLAAWAHNSTREVELLVGGCHCLRRELLDEIGFLDEALQTPLAEIELYARARQAGWHQYFLPQAEIFHPHPGRYQPPLARDNFGRWAYLRDIARYLGKKWFSRSAYPGLARGAR